MKRLLKKKCLCNLLILSKYEVNLVYFITHLFRTNNGQRDKMLWLKGHKTCKQQAVNFIPRLANCWLFILGFSHIVWSFSFIIFEMKTSLPWWLRGKESACKEGDQGSIPGSGKSSREGNGLPTPIFLPGEFHGPRSLAGYSP